DPHPLPLRLRYIFFADARADCERHLACLLVGVDYDVVAVEDFAVENLERQRILHQFLNRALQGARAEVRVVALGEQQVFGGVGQLERNFAVGEQAADVFQAQLDDVDQLFLAERAEDDDVVDAVQELRLELCVQRIQNLLRGFLELLLGTGALRLQELRSDVRGHDEDRVLEIDDAAFAV